MRKAYDEEGDKKGGEERLKEGEKDKRGVTC